MTGYIDWLKVERSLLDVIERVRDAVTPTDQKYVAEFLAVGELGFALDQLVYELAEYETPISADVRVDILLLAEVMRRTEEISGTLEHCPERTATGKPASGAG